MSVATLNTRDDFLELAERYETVAALDLTPASMVGRHIPPGTRLPPGMQEILDADEIRTKLTAVDDWTEFLAHVIAEERDVVMPDMTPARLRLVAEYTAHLIEHPDEMLALAVVDDLRHHLRTMRRLAGRGVRQVQTGIRCQRNNCNGRLISPLSDENRTDDALECDRCHHRVPWSVWSSWPRARVTYVTVAHAARMAGTTVGAVRVKAHRQKWRRIGTGGDTRYHVDDIRRASGLSA